MSSDLLTPVLRGEVCPYCGQVPKLVDSIVIYRYDGRRSMSSGRINLPRISQAMSTTHA